MLLYRKHSFGDCEQVSTTLRLGSSGRAVAVAKGACAGRRSGVQQKQDVRNNSICTCLGLAALQHRAYNSRSVKLVPAL
jgi:hypothetical protein